MQNSYLIGLTQEASRFWSSASSSLLASPPEFAINVRVRSLFQHLRIASDLAQSANPAADSSIRQCGCSNFLLREQVGTGSNARCSASFSCRFCLIRTPVVVSSERNGKRETQASKREGRNQIKPSAEADVESIRRQPAANAIEILD